MRLTTLLGSAAALYILSSCAQPERAQSQQQTPLTNSTISNNVSYLCSIRLPERLSFCGEKVPLDVPDVRERAEREFYVTLQQASQLILNVKRAGRYFPLFEKILKEENAPDDLKYIAVAESALYMARSSKDAVGIWQFIEGTAKRYGLHIDEYVDERRHVEKSTRAAIDYLKYAKKRLDSWTLAAAAYNMGTYGVEFNVEFQRLKNYYDMYFNEETSRYILRIAVWKEILEHPASYGVTLAPSELYKVESSKTITVRNAIENLADWAKEHGTTYKDVKLLNPWILKHSLPKPKSGAWEIAVPQ